MTTVAYIQDSEFDQILAAPGVLVVDCTATWCGPCRKVAPLMDQLAGEYDGQAKVFKLDLDQNKATANRYGIRSIPAVLFFKEGELVDQIVGVAPYEQFSTLLDKVLAS